MKIHEIHESGELSHVATTCNDVSNQCKPEVLELLLKLKGNGILVITVSRSTSVHMHLPSKRETLKRTNQIECLNC